MNFLLHPVRLLHPVCLIDTTEYILLTHCKVASSNTSHLEAHAGFFQIAYEGDFDPFFDKK